MASCMYYLIINIGQFLRVYYFKIFNCDVSFTIHCQFDLIINHLVFPKEHNYESNLKLEIFLSLPCCLPGLEKSAGKLLHT